jgi:capsular polysaccharide biosynthesis protein
VLTASICIFMPWTYRAETTLIIPQQNAQGLASVLALASGTSSTTNTNSTDLTQTLIGRSTNFSDILKSRTISGMIVDGLNLKAVYGNRSRDSLIRMMQKKLRIKEQKGIMKIYAYDRSPRLAADMANFAAIALDDFNKNGNVQFAKRLSLFVRDQLAIAKVDLADAEEKLKRSESQSQMVMVTERQLILGRLLRDVKVKEEVYTMLMQEYEKTKLEEAKEELFFEVLDPASVPQRPYIPKPFTYSIIALIMGSFFAVCLAFIFEYFASIGIKVPEIDYERTLEWNRIRIF